MPPGIHAGKLHKTARSYIGAARKLEEEPQFLSPRFFSLCHGLELALKAFLAAKGDRMAVLMGLGHDLSEAYKRAQEEYGLEPSDPLLDTLVRLMSPEHKKQLFRYPGRHRQLNAFTCGFRCLGPERITHFQELRPAGE